MDDQIVLKLSDLDVGQILDALIIRREAYERTREYLLGNEIGPIEEVTDLDEAENMVAIYKNLIEKVRKQRH